MYAHHPHFKLKIVFFYNKCLFQAECLEKKSPSKPGCSLKQVGEETSFKPTPFVPKCGIYFVIFIVTHLPLAPAGLEGSL